MLSYVSFHSYCFHDISVTDFSSLKFATTVVQPFAEKQHFCIEKKIKKLDNIGYKRDLITKM